MKMAAPKVDTWLMRRAAGKTVIRAIIAARSTTYRRPIGDDLFAPVDRTAGGNVARLCRGMPVTGGRRR